MWDLGNGWMSGVFLVGRLGVGRYGAHKGSPYRWDGEVGEGARLRPQGRSSRGRLSDLSNRNRASVKMLCIYCSPEKAKQARTYVLLYGPLVWFVKSAGVACKDIHSFLTRIFSFMPA